MLCCDSGYLYVVLGWSLGCSCWISALQAHLIYALLYPGSTSKELEAFRSSYSDLELVNTSDIVGQLYAKEVISRADRDDIVEKSQRSEKVGALLRAVERAITTDRRNFYKFVEVLQTQYKFLAERLQALTHKG